MTKWSTLLGPARGWARASQVGAVENARVSTTELCGQRVEREEVAAYLRANSYRSARADRLRIARSG